MMERPLVVAFSISLACHLLLLGLQLNQLRWDSPSRIRQTLELIYEATLAEAQAHRLKRQLAEHKRHMQPSALGSGVFAPIPRIRIPDRPTVALSPTGSEARVSRLAVVDLTNLVAASGGDPVLLGYFAALREQIQRTANRRTWLTQDAAEGIVYVSFVLEARGSVRLVMVLSDRSAPSRLLQDIAVRIIKASGPFPAFPPSLDEPSKTVVVPLEFLLSG